MIKNNLKYALLVALISTVSCAQQDSPGQNEEVKDNKITFRATLPAISSRAVEVTTATIDNFIVSSFIMDESSATSYFLGKTFSKNSTTGKFVCYDEKCIWPNNNDVIRFVAFAPSCEDMRLAGDFDESGFNLSQESEDTNIGDYEYKLNDFKIASDIASQVDFITAISSGKLLDDEETGITLNFHHQLSRIELKAWNASDSYYLEIAGVRIGGVATEGEFSFSPSDNTDLPAFSAGSWGELRKGSVDYIFREGDEIVTLINDENFPPSADDAVSILGAKVGNKDNSAMLIPSANPKWDYVVNKTNGDNHADGMYFSVLLRVTDITPYATDESLIYPYSDNSENMEIIYLAVEENGKVNNRVYKNDDDGEYYSDSEFNNLYSLESKYGEKVKKFGWAAIPVEGKWEPGYVYTYTLNYTNGVGLRDPHDPNPGESIISEKVLINVGVTEWLDGPLNEVNVPRK